ncbi:MAG TPA: hypothetical protein VMA83_00525 [Solirubrobacteraceae bacterium]|nr:hypothetical protein [Solirubrobacteraceae bacterium]
MTPHFLLANAGCLKQHGECGPEWLKWIVVIGILVGIVICTAGWLLTRFGCGRTARLLRRVQNKPEKAQSTASPFGE